MSIENIRRIKEEAKNKTKSYGIRKVSDKKKETIKEQLELANKDADFYLSIWRKRSHTCFECGKHLGSSFRKWYAHHIAEKSKFPEFRHDERNIVLLCQIHHDQVMLDINKVPKTKELTEQTYKLLGIEK